MIDLDPVTQLLDQVQEWEDLEDPKPPNFAAFKATLAAVEHLHGPGSCVPCWKARRGMSPVWNLLLVLVLAGVIVWFVPQVPIALQTRLQDVLELAMIFLATAAAVTVLLSSWSGRRSEKHGERQAKE